MPGLRGPSALLRLQSDEKLIALTRSGQAAAFETLCSRYQSRLLSFCRHMLNSREDAEDVLQEVFAAAYNAVLADEREINVRPWLYRIARNRSLNHLRRNTAIGVDSMDVHFAENGLSTGDRVIRRESFRELLTDVQQLPETQRTALLLREMDALSYEQIALAMETTVPSVKSLLVRARISLAEAAEARKLSCAEVRLELGEAAEGLTKLTAPARRHVRGCERCGSFKKQLKANNQALAAVLPVGPLLLFKKLVLAKLGLTASAGSAHVAGGAGATMGAGAAATAGATAGATGGGGIAGGILTAGAGALATKAVAGLAAAAIVTAGVAAADHTTTTHHHHLRSGNYARVAAAPTGPAVVAVRPQPVSATSNGATAGVARRPHHNHLAKEVKVLSPATAPAAPVAAPPVKPDAAPKPTGTQVTQVTTETTVLPSPADVQGQPSAPAPPSTVEVAAPPAPVSGVETTIPVPTTPLPASPITPPTGEETVPIIPTPPAQAPGEAAPVPSPPSE
jgi:RNA polymerase sigma factor (sigma-70 family)